MFECKLDFFTFYAGKREDENIWSDKIWCILSIILTGTSFCLKRKVLFFLVQIAASHSHPRKRVKNALPDFLVSCFYHMGNAISNAVYPSSIFFMCYMTSNKTLPIYLLRQIFSFYLLACCSFYYIDVLFLQKGSTILGVSDSFWHFIWNFFSWRMWFRLFCFLECSSNKDKTYFIVVRSCEKIVRHSSRKNVCLTDAPL